MKAVGRNGLSNFFKSHQLILIAISLLVIQFVECKEKVSMDFFFKYENFEESVNIRTGING